MKVTDISLDTLIKKYRNYSGRAFGSLFTTISKNSSLQDELRKRTQFLPEDSSIQQRFFHVWFNQQTVETCPYCDKPRSFSKRKKFSLIRDNVPYNYYQTCHSEECAKKHGSQMTKNGMLEKYGVENISQTEQWHEKIKATNNERYGVDYQTQSKNFKTKTKDTWTEKYGVEHHTKSKQSKDKKIVTNVSKYGVRQVMQNKSIMKKAQTTNVERYGGISPMHGEATKTKAKKTNQSKFGTDWYTQTQEFKDRTRTIMKKRYDVWHNSQEADFFTKKMNSRYKWKLFEFESGRLEKVQGYEQFALKDLLVSGIIENDIVIDNKTMESFTGKIWYQDTEKKTRKYFPDIYIKSECKVIEIKSEYTFYKNKPINLLKKAAVEALGFLFEFWIYDSKGKLLRII